MLPRGRAPLRPRASRRWIQNDDGVFQTQNKVHGFSLFFKLGRRNLPGVKKMSRILLIALGAVLGVAVLILIGANMYVQSKAMQARIQQELSERLDAPIQVKRISVTPWAGLKLSGITIPQTQPGVPSDFLTAKTFRLRIRFSSLFAQRLVIKDVSLINPDVVWAQNAEGKWRLPSRPPPPADEVAADIPAPEPGSEPASVSPEVTATAMPEVSASANAGRDDRRHEGRSVHPGGSTGQARPGAFSFSRSEI